MIHPGDILENPVTGERMQFLVTATQTGGERVLVETTVRPDGFVAAAHVHPAQEERFEVVSGLLKMRLGRNELQLAPGETAYVAPGTRHRFWNAGGDDVVFRTEIRPALEFERLIETMFGLAADGKTNRRGMPNPFRLAVIAQAHFDVVRLPFPPAPLQRAALAMGAPLGRLLGYTPSYEPVPAGLPVPAAI